MWLVWIVNLRTEETWHEGFDNKHQAEAYAYWVDTQVNLSAFVSRA
jgi:hypothetical protein